MAHSKPTILSAALSALLFACAPCAQAEAVNAALYSTQMEVTLAARPDATETLENFPVPIRLSAARVEGFDATSIRQDQAADLRVADADGNLIPCEVESWNPDGESVLWVIVPALPPEGTRLTLYWGVPEGAAIQSALDVAAAWQAAGYAGVWHLNTADTSPDSTGNGLDGTHGSATSFAESGIAGGARLISTEGQGTANGNAYVSIPSYDSLGLGDTFTISGWFLYKEGQTPGYDRIFSRKSNYSDGNGWEVTLRNGSKQLIDHRASNGDSQQTTVFNDVADGQWHHLSISYSGKSTSAYADGAFKKTVSLAAAASDNGKALTFGNNSSHSECCFKGTLDEIRLRAGVSSAEWVAAEYAAMTDDAFVTCAAPEFINPNLPQILPPVGVTVDYHAADLTWEIVSTGIDTPSVSIRYGTDPEALDQTVQISAEGAVGIGTWRLEGLLCNTLYYAKIVLTNSEGSAETALFQIATPGAPTVGAVSATAGVGEGWIDGSGSLLDAGVSAATLELWYRTQDGEWTLAQSWPDLTGEQSVSYRIENLPFGIYELRLRAWNACNGQINEVFSPSAEAILYGTVTWTGAAMDMRWGNPANWDSGTVPTYKDTVCLTDIGIATGATFLLEAPRAVESLIIRAVGGFTFGTTNDVAAGASLQLRDFRREAPASGSTPGEIAFCKALPILLTGDGDGQSNWYVCENATIWMEGLVQVAATGESISFVKTGAGQIAFAYANSVYRGPWFIREGTCRAGGIYRRAAVKDTMRGTFTVGGTEASARLIDDGCRSSPDTSGIVGNSAIHVLTNGFFQTYSPKYNCLGSVTVHAGGEASLGGYCYVSTLNFYGGLISDGNMYGGNSKYINVYASDQTAIARNWMTAPGYQNGYITVEDGAAPVDFLMTGSCTGTQYSPTAIYRRGDGTAIFTGNSTLYRSKSTDVGYYIQAGRSIYDNTSGSALGTNPAEISGGAIVGGSGRLGGTSTNFTLKVTGTAAKPSTLAPGSIDYETAEPLCGTLTIGSENYPSSLSMSGGYVLDAQIGPGSEADRLLVYGMATLGETGGTLRITIDDAAHAGQYVLLHATDGLTGTFENLEIISSKPQTLRVHYTDTDVLYVFDQQTMLILR